MCVTVDLEEDKRGGEKNRGKGTLRGGVAWNGKKFGALEGRERGEKSMP